MLDDWLYLIMFESYYDFFLFWWLCLKVMLIKIVDMYFQNSLSFCYVFKLGYFVDTWLWLKFINMLLKLCFVYVLKLFMYDFFFHALWLFDVTKGGEKNGYFRNQEHNTTY